MWSSAHMAAMQEDLGSILTQTQMALLDLPSPFFQTTDLFQLDISILHSFVILRCQVEINNAIINLGSVRG
jgi:hypothetical protein